MSSPDAFFEQCLHLRAVLAHDVGEVPARVIQPFGFKVYLVGEQIAAERTERAERVRRKQHAVSGVERDHRLGPMHHRSHYERERMAAGIERVALLYYHRAGGRVECEELVHHGQRLFVADQLYLGPARDYARYLAAVIRLHVVDYQVIERTAVQRVLDVFKEQIAYGVIDGVQQHGLFIQTEVGVI